MAVHPSKPILYIFKKFDTEGRLCNCQTGLVKIALLFYTRVKGKGLPLTCLEGTEGSRGIALLVLNLGARWRGMLNRQLYPRERDPVCIVQGGSHRQSGRVRKRRITCPSSTLGFDIITIQPIASRYPDSLHRSVLQ